MTARLKILTAVSLLLMAATLLSAPLARATGQLGNSGKFVGWWELGGYYGTDDSSRGEAVLFTPLMQSATTLFFLDARGKLFEDDVQEANVALGYRQMMASGWNLGLWAGWDVRDTEVDNTFHQVSFGLEALSERFDLRLNGYVPVTDPKASPELAEVFLRGNNILMVGGEELALHGLDGEVGMLLFASNRGGGGGSKGAPAPARRHELRGYVGGFWFDDDDADEEIAGPKGRLEYRINDVVSALPGSRLTLESQLSHDEVRDTKFEVGARLRIPFGARGSDAASRTAALNAQELRMIEGLERDTDIVTTISKEENVTDVATNVALDSVSIAKNATQFANAVDAGGNRLIILQKGSQRIDVSGTDGQQLQKNQTVQGGASTIPVRGRRTGTVAGFTAPGKRPTLFTDDINLLTGAITVANNTHIAGLNFRGIGSATNSVGGNRAIYGLEGRNNVVIEQSDIRNLGDDSIRFEENASNIRIWTTNIEDVGADAIEFEDFARNIEIYDVTITDPNFEAIDFDEDNNRNITIKKVTVANTDRDVASDGFEFGNFNRNILIEDVTLFNPGAEGIEFGDNNENIVIRDVGIRNARFESIEIDNDNSDILIEDVTIRNSGFESIEFNDRNTDVVIRNARIFNSGFDAIELDDDNEITIVDSLIDGVGNGDAIHIDGPGNTVNVDNTTFAGTIQGDILEVQAAGNVINGAGNINNANVGGFVCNGAGNFTGSITIGNQTFVNGAGCN